MSKVKQTLADKERQRLTTENGNTTFIERNVSLNYFLLYFLYPIAALYSIFTGGSALLVYMQSVFSNLTAALIITGFIISALELAKFFFGAAMSDDIRHHVWTESKNHVIAFLLKLVAFIGVFAASITLSLTGAPDVAESYRETRTPVESSLIDLEAIKSEFDNKIASERQDIVHASNMTWKGAIIKDGRQIIKEAKANISILEKSRQNALKDARGQNDSIIQDYNSDTAKAGNWMTGFAGAGEVLALLILFFLANYKSGALSEVNSELTAVITAPVITTPVNVAPNNSVFSENTVQRQPIGFRIPNSSPNSDNSRHLGKGKVKIGSCLHCGNEYEQTVWNKKFCSDDCRMDYHAQKHNGRRFSPKRYQAKK